MHRSISSQVGGVYSLSTSLGRWDIQSSEQLIVGITPYDFGHSAPGLC